MKITNRNANVSPQPKITVRAPQTEEKKDTFVSGTLRETLNTVRSAGDAVGRVTGGAAGIGGAVAGAWLGSLGGAATMGVLGLGAGIPGAILAGEGGFSILGSAFSTAGTAARAGIVLATACGAVGGYFLGEKAGYAAGYVPTAVLSVPVGLVSGAGKSLAGTPIAHIPFERPASEPERAKGKLEKTVGSIVSGVGVLSGAAGGFALGGLVASGASLASGLVARDVAFKAIMSSGAWGGAIGAGVGAVLLGVGGYKLVDGAGDLAHAAGRKLARGKERVELDMRSQELDKRIAGLEQASEALKTQEARTDAYFAAATQAVADSKVDAEKRLVQADEKIVADSKQMDKKEAVKTAELDGILANVAQKIENQDGIAQSRADGDLVALKGREESRYQTRKGQLASWESNMNSRQTEWERKNTEADQIVETEASRRTENTRQGLESAFQTRKSGLDRREAGLKTDQAKLDARRADLPNLIRAEGDKHIAQRTGELEKDLATFRAGLQSELDRTAATLQNERQREQERLNDVLGNRQSQYQAQETAAQSVVTSLEGTVSGLRREVDQKEDRIQDARSRTQSAQRETQQVLSSIVSDKGSLEREASQAKSEVSGLRSRAASARSEATSARRDAENAKAGYQQAAQEFNGLQAEIQRLSNEIANHV